MPDAKSPVPPPPELPGKEASTAGAPLPKSPIPPKGPSPTGGVTDLNNPGSLAPPDFSDNLLKDGADTDAMFAEVQKKSADLHAVNAAERAGKAPPLPGAPELPKIPELPKAADAGAEAAKALGAG